MNNAAHANRRHSVRDRRGTDSGLELHPAGLGLTLHDEYLPQDAVHVALTEMLAASLVAAEYGFATEHEAKLFDQVINSRFLSLG